MNLERGFRRLVVTISFAAATAGLVVTGYDTYKTFRYVSANKKYAACIKEATSWTPTVEDFLNCLTESKLPELLSYHRFVARSVPRWAKRVQGANRGTYDPSIINDPRFADLSAAEQAKILGNLSNESYTLALLPLIWGILLTTGLGAIPWGVFYLVRWIVQGFKE